MVFEQEFSSKETKEELQGSLSAAVHAIILKASGNLSVDYDKFITEEKETVSVTFYADAITRDQPVTFKEAFEAYVSLPEFAKTSKTPVTYSLSPISIWCKDSVKELITISVIRHFVLAILVSHF